MNKEDLLLKKIENKLGCNIGEPVNHYHPINKATIGEKNLIIKYSLSDSENFNDLKREGNYLKRLESIPGIINLISCGEIKDLQEDMPNLSGYYVTKELLPGPALKDLEAISTTQAKYVMDTQKKVHERNILYQSDLKLSDFVLDKHELPILVDFGKGSSLYKKNSLEKKIEKINDRLRLRSLLEYHAPKCTKELKFDFLKSYFSLGTSHILNGAGTKLGLSVGFSGLLMAMFGSLDIEPNTQPGLYISGIGFLLSYINECHIKNKLYKYLFNSYFLTSNDPENTKLFSLIQQPMNLSQMRQMLLFRLPQIPLTSAM